MKGLNGVCLLILAGSSAALSQTAASPPECIGTWALNVQESTFGTILFPGAAAGLAIVSQTLRIEQNAREIRLSGDTVLSGGGLSYSTHDSNSFSLDGRETVIETASFYFRRTEDAAFDIVSQLNIRNRNIREVSHFSFSSDGGKLTETKTQTEKEVVPAGSDESFGSGVRTSTFVLVFNKIPDR